MSHVGHKSQSATATLLLEGRTEPATVGHSEIDARRRRRSIIRLQLLGHGIVVGSHFRRRCSTAALRAFRASAATKVGGVKRSRCPTVRSFVCLPSSQMAHFTAVVAREH